MVWDRGDYLVEADKQLKDNETYESSSFKDADLIKLVENLLEKGNLLLKKNVTISLMNKRRPPILGKCINCLKSISV